MKERVRDKYYLATALKELIVLAFSERVLFVGYFIVLFYVLF
jgi:hypothetical protein